MAPPSKRFQPIQRIADERERKAAISLGEKLKAKSGVEQQLKVLTDYHADYLERYRQAVQSGLPAVQLRGYQQFLDQLEAAIKQQRLLLSGHKSACDASKAHWNDQYRRSQVMNNVVDRLKQDERRESDKREQSALDERNQRKNEIS
jgi:flagellar FliJ protein